MRSIHEQFIPGLWMDNIDVNDFVNLNKKPFFDQPFFLKESSSFSKNLAQSLAEMMQKEEYLVSPESAGAFPFFSAQWEVDSPYLPVNQSQVLQPAYGHTESKPDISSFYKMLLSPSVKHEKNKKSSYQLFEEVATSEMKKSKKISLFHQNPSNFTPAFAHPDVRRIPLYGTKQLIKDKRWYLKTSEKHLQTSEWIQKRISIQEQIHMLKELEQFAKKEGIDISLPAADAKEALLFLYVTILACVNENPSVPFSLSSVIPFLDIYFENDLQKGTLSESQVQEMIEHFYMKLCLIRFTPSPQLTDSYSWHPHFFGETVHGSFICKTTYRFLHAVKTFSLHPLVISVVLNDITPTAFKEYCHELVQTHGVPLTFIQETKTFEKEHALAAPFGMSGIPGEDILLDTGSFDAEKAFFLSLNGGKDLHTNMHLLPVVPPYRKKELEFNEIFEKYKEFLSYSINLYAEIVNSLAYLNDTGANHPLRYALLSNRLFYHFQFGFFHIRSVVRMLTSIKQNIGHFERNEDGWILGFVTDCEQEDETILAQLAAYIAEEIKKIPLYRHGVPSIRFYGDHPNTLSTFEEAFHLNALPANYIDVQFPMNIDLHHDFFSLDLLEKVFSRNIQEVHISTKSVWNFNGVLAKEGITYKKDR